MVIIAALFFVPVVISEPCVGQPPQPGTAEETQEDSPGMNGMCLDNYES